MPKEKGVEREARTVTEHNKTDTTEEIVQDALEPAAAMQLMRQDQRERQGHSGVGRLQSQAALQLSSLMGNRALQRNLPGEREADAPTTDDAMPAEMHEFLSRGMMPDVNGLDMTGAGGIGGFNAKYNPDARELIVTMNVGFDMLNGLEVDDVTGTVRAGTGLDPNDPTEKARIVHLQGVAADLNNTRTKEQRIAEVRSRWQWTEGEITPWLDEYRQRVQDAWAFQHFFVSQDWPQLQSSVRVVANVHLGKQKGDHCKAKIVKSPPNNIGAVVQSGQGNKADDQELIMSSSSLGPTTNFLNRRILFENNSADISTARGDTGDAGPRFLDRFIATFNAATATGGVPIKLIGRASSTGATAHNQRLSEERAANVERYLRDKGLVGSIDRTTASAVGEEGATEGAEFRRVDMIVGSGEAQVTSVHEFGHMLGLDDEYGASTIPNTPGFIGNAPQPIGTPVEHNDVNNNGGIDGPIDGAVSENNDSIMSLGNTVRPQHYSTFHHALQTVTGKRWTYGSTGSGAVVPGTPVPGGGVIT